MYVFSQATPTVDMRCPQRLVLQDRHSCLPPMKDPDIMVVPTDDYIEECNCHVCIEERTALGGPRNPLVRAVAERKPELANNILHQVGLDRFSYCISWLWNKTKVFLEVILA